MVVIGILGLLVGILAVAVIPKLTEAKNKLEVKQLGDLMQGFQGIAADEAKKRKVNKLDSKIKGEKFYEAAFKKKIFEAELVTKLVSLNSTTDTKADKAWIDEDDAEMPANACSYTAPIGVKLLQVMNKKGKKRKILITFNERNWMNYPDHGVIVQWSDGETAQYMMKDEASDEYGIDTETWANSPEEIIGEKSPFDETFS